MMKRLFDIVTDSSCDFPETYYSEHGLELVRLGYLLDGGNYEGEDGAHISDTEFYAKLRAGAMPTTYQITPEAATPHIEKSLAAGRDVLVIAFSSGLSGTADSYVSAAKALKEKYPDRKVAVVDSLCASMGEGLFADYLVRKADSGATLEETVAYAEKLRPHICHYFTVDNLFHLKRGGRVSAATAVVGTVLNIKPVLHVNDEGRLIALSKTMGRKKSVLALLRAMEELQILEEGDPIFISHGDCVDDAEMLAGLVREKFPGHEIVISYIGPVIGAHSGAGTLALFFRGKHR